MYHLFSIFDCEFTTNIEQFNKLTFLVKTRCINTITDAITVFLNFLHLAICQGYFFKHGSKFLMLFV